MKPESIKYKYDEDKFLKTLSEYIENTYSGHYVGDGKNIQTVDFIYEVLGDTGFLQGNAIKYLARYGKKDGKNVKDLLKAVHYIMLLHHFSTK